VYVVHPADPARKTLAMGQNLAVLLPVAAVLVGVAVAGWLSSLLVGKLAAADPTRALPRRPVRETWGSLRQLTSNAPLFRAALGIAFFWFLASLANLNIDVFGNGDLGMRQQDIGILLGILVLGLGAGSVLAGFFSGDKVELGLVPLGAFGVALFAFLLYLTGTQATVEGTITTLEAFRLSGVWLFLLGVAAGLFDIPLEAFLQQRSPVKTRGTILAAGNFIAFTLMLGSAGLFYVLQDLLGLSASQILLVARLGTIPVMIYALVLLPQATIRFVVWLASHTVYRVRVFGRHYLPESGGALLLSNHVSWLDGIFLLMTS
jgi:acyl-[acyl-carrier-protein]-phospholipid O-acyltransferase/long-chain-fatty-acid--[acyl-carrier-protein] ligase